MHIKWLGICSWALLLGACATGYQKSSITGGYSERRINDSAYVVSFNGNGFASKDRVYYFWIYRCAELTLQQGYGLYVIQPNRSSANRLPPDPAFKPAVLTLGEGGGFIKTHGGGGGVIVVPMAGSGATKWTYSATVLMYKKPLAKEQVWGIDAEQTVALLKPYVTANGNITPPTREELFRKAFIAHARIDIFGGIMTAVNGPAPAALQPRSLESISDTLVTSRLIALHEMYRIYVTRFKSIDPNGEALIDFSISPNGQVADCHVTSTNITDRGFVDAIGEMMRQTQFGAQDVAPTQVTRLHISFQKLPDGVDGSTA
jgi:hypothetical protein